MILYMMYNFLLLLLVRQHATHSRVGDASRYVTFTGLRYASVRKTKGA